MNYLFNVIAAKRLVSNGLVVGSYSDEEDLETDEDCDHESGSVPFHLLCQVFTTLSNSIQGLTESLSPLSEPSLTSPTNYTSTSLSSPALTFPDCRTTFDWSCFFQSTFNRPNSAIQSIPPPLLETKQPVGTDPRDTKNPLSIWRLTRRLGANSRIMQQSVEDGGGGLSDEEKH